MTKKLSKIKKWGVPIALTGVFFVGTAFRNDFFEIAKQIEIFTNLYKTVNMNYVDETNPGKMMDAAIKNMLAELDPYTVYFNEADVLKFKINNTGEYTGIGALITRKEGKIIIKEPYKGFPADKAGLVAGDEIIQIDDVKLIDFKDDASQLLKGTKNSKVQIHFIRQGKTQQTTIVLDAVEVKAVPFFGKIDNETGYIVLNQFNQKASAETKAALLELKSQGITKLVLDLRGNPGGLLGEAVNICNIFVPKGETIVTTKSKNSKHSQTYKTQHQPLDLEIPLAIIIDGKSASASEIVSGALQDLDRAVVIGSRSFGKGLVQRPMDLTYGTQVKVTISRYYTPSGRCIQSLDYSKRDAQGKGVAIDQNNYTAFKTRAGRTVYDGGGIFPDIELKETKTSAIAEALTANDLLFNFATQYYHQKSKPNNGIPTITDADFQDFKKYLKTEKFSFDTETEKALKKTLEAAKKEGVDELIIKEYTTLETALMRSEEQQLELQKEEIKNLIQEDLIKRYGYREGLYTYYIQHNFEVKKATEILNNTSAYRAILK